MLRKRTRKAVDHLRAVGKIGIGKHYHMLRRAVLARRLKHRCTNGAALAAIVFIAADANAALSERANDIGAAVGAAIVRHDKLPASISPALTIFLERCGERFDRIRYYRRFIVHRYAQCEFVYTVHVLPFPAESHEGAQP